MDLDKSDTMGVCADEVNRSNHTARRRLCVRILAKITHQTTKALEVRDEGGPTISVDTRILEFPGVVIIADALGDFGLFKNMLKEIREEAYRGLGE